MSHVTQFWLRSRGWKKNSTKYINLLEVLECWILLEFSSSFFYLLFTNKFQSFSCYYTTLQNAVAEKSEQIDLAFFVASWMISCFYISVCKPYYRYFIIIIIGIKWACIFIYQLVIKKAHELLWQEKGHRKGPIGIKYWWSISRLSNLQVFQQTETRKRRMMVNFVWSMDGWQSCHGGAGERSM